MRVGTILWALATLLTAIVSGLGLVILARILLGIAEAPAFASASKAAGYWFPLNERGRATSAFDAAAKFSNVIGVPILTDIVADWTGAFAGNFVIAGAILLVGIFSYIVILGLIEPILEETPTERLPLPEAERGLRPATI
jgi:ACS family D-galactonate transporter-like MFS transporter